MAKILLVENEPDLVDVVKDRLEEELHLVEIARDSESTLELLAAHKFDLAIFNQGGSAEQGAAFCNSLKNAGHKIPVLILAAAGSELPGFNPDEGADDYLTRPFEWTQLTDRVDQLLSRPSAGDVEAVAEFAAGELVLDRRSCKVLKSGVHLHLLPKEYMMLECLMRNDRRVVSVDKLMDQVWGSETAITAETVRSYIKTLRKKIDTPGKNSLIKNIYGMGYKLDATECITLANQPLFKD